MEKTSNKKKILIIAVIAVLLLLALLFGLNRCGKGVKTDGITVYESQDNSNAIPQYDENSEHVFSFIPAESEKGDITYELISAKDQEFKEVNYFTLVSENDTQIKVAKGTPAETYTLTIRCYAGDNKDEYKDITYIYKIDKAASSYTIEPSGIAGLVYNGEEQELVKPGTASYGTIYYKVNDGEWSQEIPKATEAGIYTVSYKLVGDQNHADIKEKSIMVSIDRKTVAYKPGVSLSSSFSLSDMKNYIKEKSSEATNKNVPVSGKPAGLVEYEYDGNTHSNGYLPPRGIKKMGEDTGTDAGTYVAVYYPDTNYCWSDGTRNPVSVTLVIRKKKVAVPTADEPLEYTGEEQTLTLINFDETVMSVRGNTGTAVGQYRAIVSLKDRKNYCWSDGTVLDKIITWHIVARSVNVPYVETVFTFNGFIQRVKESDMGDFDPSIMRIVSGNYGTVAKDYEMKVALRDKKNYVWNDEEGGTDNRTIVWTIHPYSVGPKPENPEPVAYDGLYHSNGYDQPYGVSHIGGKEGGREVGEYTATYKPRPDYCWDDGTNDEVSVTLSIVKAESEYIKEPAAREGLVYNGKSQKLMNVGKAKGGTIAYKIGEDGRWSEDVPEVINAGTYKVYYKIFGDKSHEDSDETCVAVEVKKATPTVIKAPTVIDILYDEKEHELISYGGKVRNGSFYFVCGEIGTSDPSQIKATEPGEYTINVIIKGADENYETDIEYDTLTAYIRYDDRPSVKEEPKALKLYFNNEDQELIEEGVPVNGEFYYSLEPRKEWSKEIPTAKDADNYYVYYKVVSDDGRESSVGCVVSVIIKVKATINIESSETTYTGKDQDLLKATTEDGTLSYSMTGYFYRDEVPQRKNTGEYTVYYKIKGDKNHNDTYEAVKCTIKPADIEYEPRDGEVKTFDYDPKMDHYVVVTAKTVDGYTDMDKWHVKISYGEEPGVYTKTRRPVFREVGTHPVYFKIEADNHNTVEDWYVVEIKEAAATYQVEPKAVEDLIYNGGHQNLLSPGKTKDGTILYAFEATQNWSEEIPWAEEAGIYRVGYMIRGDENHSDSEKTYVDVEIEKAYPQMDGDNMPEGVSVEYNGQYQQLLAKPGQAIHGKIRYEFGDLVTYNAAEVVADNACAKGDDGKLIPYVIDIYIEGDPNYYDISWGQVESFITPTDETTYKTRPTAKDLTYTGNAQELINPGETVDGTILYRIEPNGRWSEEIPTAMNAGKYLIGYYIEGDSDHEDTKKEFVEAEIKKADWTVNVVRNTTTYTGNAQELVEITAEGGEILYSRKGYVFINRVPKETNVGDYEIHYIVSKDKNHNETKGTVECSITPATLSYNADSKTFTYDPRADHGIIVTVRTVDGYTDMDKRHVTISYGREEGDYTTTKAPMFHDAGVYEVFFQIEAENHVTVRSSYTITIEQAENVFDAPTGLELKYTGSEQALVTEGRVYTPGAELLYSTDGGKTYSDSVPKAADVGEYYVYYKCVNSDPNYQDSSDLDKVESLIKEANEDQSVDLDNTPAPGSADGAPVDGTLPGSDDYQNDDNNGENNDQLPTLEDIITQDPVYDNGDQVVGDNNDQLPNLENDGTQGQEDNYVEPQGSAEPQSGLMMAQNVIMQVVPTVYDHDIFRIGANIQSIDILDQRDNFGNAVTFFSEDGKQIIRSPLAPAGTYIIEAKVKIAWIVDENGQAQAIILDSDIEKPVDEIVGGDDNYAYQYYQQAVAEAQQNYDYDDDDDNDQTPQIVTPEVTAPQDDSSLDVEEFLKEEEDSDPNSEVFYENKQDESDEQPAEGAE